MYRSFTERNKELTTEKIGGYRSYAERQKLGVSSSTPAENPITTVTQPKKNIIDKLRDVELKFIAGGFKRAFDKNPAPIDILPALKERGQLLKSDINKFSQKINTPKGLAEVSASAAMGTVGASGEVRTLLQKGVVPSGFLENLAKDKNVLSIENKLKSVGLDEANAKILASNLAPTKTVQEVENTIINHQSPGIVPSKTPVVGETPAEALARSEAYAKQAHPTVISPTNVELPKVQISDEGIPMARKSVPILSQKTQPLTPNPLPENIKAQGVTPTEIPIPRAVTTNLPPADVSLLKTIQKEPTPVNEKVGIVDYIRTPDRVLKKIGLENEGKFLRTQHEKYLQELPKNIDKITQWAKQASPEGNQAIFDYLDGQPVTLKPQDQKIAEEIKTWLSQWADRLGLPQDQRIQHYITHIFDKELITKEFPEELAKIIDNKIPGEVYDPFLQQRLGALGYRKDTWKALDAYVKRATRKVYMDPALETIKNASRSLEQTQEDYVKSYINKINMRPSKTDNLVDNSIKQVIGYKLGQRPTLAITRVLRQMTYRAFLGLNPASALKNISQGINTYAVLGEKYTTLGYIKLLQKGAKKELEREGVLNAGFIEDRALSATKKTLEKVDKTLFYFFDKAEHINRGSAYFGAKAKGLAQGMTEQEAIEYAKEIVRKTQFAFGKIDTPIALSSDIGKTLLQFQSYGTKQIEFLAEMAKKAATGDEKAKNILGLLRYALAGSVFVYTIGKAFGMKPTDLIPSVRLDIPASLKFPFEVGKAVVNAPDKYGNKRSFGKKLGDVGNSALGLVPAGNQVKKTIKGLKEGDLRSIVFGPKYNKKGKKSIPGLPNLPRLPKSPQLPRLPKI